MKRGMPSGAQTPDGIIFLLALIFSKSSTAISPSPWGSLGIHLTTNVVLLIVFMIAPVVFYCLRRPAYSAGPKQVTDLHLRSGAPTSFASGGQLIQLDRSRSKTCTMMFFVRNKKTGMVNHPGFKDPNWRIDLIF